MKKILFIASIYPFLDGFEKNNIKICQQMGMKVYTAANILDTSTNIKYSTTNIDDLGVQKFNVDIHRSPFSLKNIMMYKKLKKFIKNEKINIIDCHTPIGVVLGRLLGKSTGCKVIYTAHGFHFYKGAPKKNWFFYYTIEKYLARYTDVLITINKEDFENAKSFKLKKNGRLFYVPGIGVDLNKVENIPSKRSELLDELKLPNSSILMLSVGELNVNKNHISVINALPSLPENIHYIICGQGDLRDRYLTIAKKLNVESRVHLLGFRNDVISIMKSCDFFIFPSKREGLSVALMEAIACKKICIASKIRGNIDLINANSKNILLDIDTFTEDLVSTINQIIVDKKEYDNDLLADIYSFSIESIENIMKGIYIKV